MTETGIVVSTMTPAEARQCVDRIKAGMGDIMAALVALRDGRGWLALGYASLRECAAAEFGFSERRAYQLLDAADVCTIVQNEVPESHARELAPILHDDPAQVATVWQEAQERYGEDMTAANIRTVVQERTNVYQPIAATVFSSRSEEYDTPVHILEAARAFLGGIDLDPASNVGAQENVRATVYYTKETDGLVQPWRGRVWLNPPYGKTGGQSNQEIWAQRLIAEYEAGHVTEGLLLVKAALGYNWFEDLFTAWPVCFVRERLSFILDNGSDSGSSKQGTAIFYIGPRVRDFARAFMPLGRVIPAEAIVNAALWG